MSIKRYDLIPCDGDSHRCYAHMDDTADGDWVLNEDHAAEIARLTAELAAERDEVALKAAALAGVAKQNDILAAENERLRAKCGRLQKSLGWSMKSVDDSLMFDDEDRPQHDCEFYSNPEKGACSFCEGYWSARELLDHNDLSPKEATDG